MDDLPVGDHSEKVLAAPTRSPDLTPEEKAGPQVGTAMCLSGGGYRAMLFHLGALWRLNEAGLLPKLDRISSVSGGSIIAGALAMNWSRLGFSASGVGANFVECVVTPIRRLADRTIDEWSILSGALLPGTIADKVTASYDRHLFGGKTLADLPDAPKFIFNSTNVQTGSLWRFSKQYMGDWRVGLIRNPKVPLARAVAASSAFPPVLSPLHLDVDPKDFDAKTAGPLFTAPYNDEVVLSDGGVYDNLGLETAWKRYKTILVSDGGLGMAPDPNPKGDWARHSMRVLELIDNQVRCLRKRQVINSYTSGERSGTYWGIRTHIADYGLADPMPCNDARVAELAAVKTRLKSMDGELQERLINWGYAVCDAALRKHVNPQLRAGSFPYARGV